MSDHAGNLSHQGPAEVGDFVWFDDGAYQCTTHFACAGFVVKDNRIVAIAPILRKRFWGYWQLMAKKVGTCMCPNCFAMRIAP